MTVSRRDLLKGIAGITAAGVLLPGEETVKKFWRGWSAAQAAPIWTDPFAYLAKWDTVFLLEDRTTGFGRIATWTGRSFVPSVITGYQREVPAVRDMGFNLAGMLSASPLGHGFPVIDVSRYAVPDAGPPVEAKIAEGQDPVGRIHFDDGRIDVPGRGLTMHISAMADPEDQFARFTR